MSLGLHLTVPGICWGQTNSRETDILCFIAGYESQYVSCYFIQEWMANMKLSRLRLIPSPNTHSTLALVTVTLGHLRFCRTGVGQLFKLKAYLNFDFQLIATMMNRSVLIVSTIYSFLNLSRWNAGVVEAEIWARWQQTVKEEHHKVIIFWERTKKEYRNWILSLSRYSLCYLVLVFHNVFSNFNFLSTRCTHQIGFNVQFSGSQGQ